MDDKIIVQNVNYIYATIFILLFALSITVYDSFNSGDDSEGFLSQISPLEEPEVLYQGPVPEGYDLNHFRKTGETIKK